MLALVCAMENVLQEITPLIALRFCYQQQYHRTGATAAAFCLSGCRVRPPLMSFTGRTESLLHSDVSWNTLPRNLYTPLFLHRSFPPVLFIRSLFASLQPHTSLLLKAFESFRRWVPSVAAFVIVALSASWLTPAPNLMNRLH